MAGRPFKESTLFQIQGSRPQGAKSLHALSFPQIRMNSPQHVSQRRVQVRSVATRALCRDDGEATGAASFCCSLPAYTRVWFPGTLLGFFACWWPYWPPFGHKDKTCWLSPPGPLLQRSLHRPEGMPSVGTYSGAVPCPATERPHRAPPGGPPLWPARGAAYPILLPTVLLPASSFVCALALPERRLHKAGASQSVYHGNLSAWVRPGRVQPEGHVACLILHFPSRPRLSLL